AGRAMIVRLGQAGPRTREKNVAESEKQYCLGSAQLPDRARVPDRVRLPMVEAARRGTNRARATPRCSFPCGSLRKALALRHRTVLSTHTAAVQLTLRKAQEGQKNEHE